MGKEGLTPVMPTDSSNNLIGPKTKEQVVKEYYEFFNYKDPNAWGSKDLMDKYLLIAEERDFHTQTSASGSDGFLSKKEYEIFLQYVKTEDKKNFQKIETTEEENKAIKENRTFETINEKHTAVTNKDKSTLKALNNTATAGIGIAGVGAIGMIASAMADGCLGAITIATGWIGLTVALVACVGIWGYTAHINNKIEKYDAQQQENQTEIQNSEGQ